ncbi:MAG: DUF881 domain-containing protein [Selenomonadaceae bacterium]|nr:DUF881 domain-containing protein [Selenomonadaceae bacterium]MBQ7629385.1 DUF881 domain-containing protein [Selenomonadaceae bacterium]
MQIFHLIIFHASNEINSELSAQIVKLESERDALKLKLDAVEKLSEIDSADLIAELKIKACLTALEGEGVKIILHDSDKKISATENPNTYIIHDDDLLRVINELRAAGAEAISINNQRLTALSEIRCAGPTLSVNNVRSSAPFEVYAIGDKKTLANAITMRGGVADTLGVWGIKVEVETSDKIYIPAYKGEFSGNYSSVTE